jgi:hypothetical protein
VYDGSPVTGPVPHTRGRAPRTAGRNPVVDLVSTVETPTLNGRRELDDQAAASGDAEP